MGQHLSPRYGQVILVSGYPVLTAVNFSVTNFLACENWAYIRKKINSDIRPVFTSKKIADDIRVAEAKPPLINQQCVVYKFKCDLCDADYVGYTRRHLFQRIDEHKHSAIGKHLRDSHNQKNKDLTEQFTILKKYREKFECLIYEMLFIQEKKPKLNTQSDSIKAKLFSTRNS